MTKPYGINLLTDTDSLIAINGEPSAGTTLKKITQLERHSRNFIARSPFCLLATASSEGCEGAIVLLALGESIGRPQFRQSLVQ